MRESGLWDVGAGAIHRRRIIVHGLEGMCGALMLSALLLEPHLGLVARLALGLGAGILAVLTTFNVAYGGRALREMDGKATLLDGARAAHQQVEELFAMTDMLQAADGHDDAGAVLMSTSTRLLPGYSGALYVFNNSRDRLDLAVSWSAIEGFSPPETLLPGSCWALKRGKPHINDPAANTLACTHAIGAAATVELPMMARGQVYGLLMLGTEGTDCHARLLGIRRLGRALADSMSLALSNIALRERLRTLSLRDSLTGLYNRRYMEDALERYVDLAERTGCPTSVVMIDLDNFKHLNDEHGHAKGDAVLRDVAAQLVGGVRPADVVARYGGEELLIVLPNCSLDDALARAELLRERIAGLSEAHGVSVSASFGVANVPETSSGTVDVIPMADAALYAAKQAGKNCVHPADRRNPRVEAPPRLVSG